MRTNWTGVGTAVVTPFTRSGALDEAAVRRLGRRQIDAGVHFLVPCGTTGETPTLTDAERVRVVELLERGADLFLLQVQLARQHGGLRNPAVYVGAVDGVADPLCDIRQHQGRAAERRRISENFLTARSKRSCSGLR